MSGHTSWCVAATCCNGMQVCDFVRVHAPRSAPQDWWCKPPALPAPARKQAKAASTTRVLDRHPTPKPMSARGKASQTPRLPATNSKATAKLKADDSSTPATDPRTVELPEARCASAPAAVKQGSKRKHASSSGKRAKVKAAVVIPPASDQAASGNAAAEPAGVSEAHWHLWLQSPADHPACPPLQMLQNLQHHLCLHCCQIMHHLASGMLSHPTSGQRLVHPSQAQARIPTATQLSTHVL